MTSLDKKCMMMRSDMTNYIGKNITVPIYCSTRIRNQFGTIKLVVLC